LTDPAVPKSIAGDLALMGHGDERRRDVELSILTAAKQRHSNTHSRLRTVPGIGELLSRVLLYEIHAIQRVPRGQDFVSSCRLVKGATESVGKRYGTSGTQSGHTSLTWAFSEAAVRFLRANPVGQTSFGRLEKKHGKGKALMSVWAHRRARAVYDMWQRHAAFAMHTFFTGSRSGAGELGASLATDGIRLTPML
jgi:transposase